MDYTNIPEAEMVVRDVIQRFSKKKLGTTIYVIGLSGTGKSSTSQRLAELITEKCSYEPQTYIVDSLLSFLDALIKSKLGDIIIIEEISVLFPSRRAMSGENVAIGKTLDTCRKKQLCLIANCPIWNSVDSHMRAMGNVLIETLKILRKEKVVISKCLRLQTNPSSGKTYYHAYQRNGRDVKMLYTRMPNSERWSEYESQKDEFMKVLYQNLKFKQEKKEKKENKDSRPVRPQVRALTTRELQVHQLVNVKGQQQLQAARELGLSEGRISQLLKNIKKKSLKNEENAQFRGKKPLGTPLS